MSLKEDLNVRVTISKDVLDEINKKMKLRIKKGIGIDKNKEYLIPKEIFEDNKKVKDEIRYMIDKKEISFIGEVLNDTLIPKKYESFHKIVIILESPHKNEYDYGFNPIAPAQGCTANNLENYLESFVSRLDIDKNKKYLLILINSIQWQCSLGSFYNDSIIKELRDSIWDKLWSKYEVKNYFKGRLEKINPDIIVNLCTDSSKQGRRAKVQDIIFSNDGLKENVIFFTGNHPCSWNRNKNNRYILKVCNNDKVFF